MNENWQAMASAPKDGTWIQAEIPGHGSDNVIAFLDGHMDADEQPCGCWCFVTEQEPPPDWTDGVCWASNENEVPSTQPVRWKHLSATPAQE